MRHEYRIRSGRANVDFTELKKLCTTAGDTRSLAIGLAGLTLATQLDGRSREALGLATELVQLLESVGDSFLTVSLCTAYLNTILAGGQIAAVLRLADRVVGLVEGNPREGELISVSPLANALAIRGTARWCLGLPGWRDDFDRAIETVAAIPPQFRSGTFYIVYLMTIPNGVLVSREPALAEIAEIALGR